LDLAKAAARILGDEAVHQAMLAKRLARTRCSSPSSLKKKLSAAPAHQRRARALGLSLTKIYPVSPDFTGIEADPSYLIGCELRQVDTGPRGLSRHQ
jgi:hypothetical protein